MNAPDADLNEVKDPELRASLARLWQVMQERGPEEPPPPLMPAKVIQLPLWPEPQRGVPNDLLRSALFAAIQGKTRAYVKQHLVAAYDGIRIKYTGEQLDQSDLDVWEQAVHLARQHPLGTVCHFTAYGFLRTLERNAGKSDYQWLHSVFLRLQTCAVEIYKDRQIYSRSLVTKFDIDEVSRSFKVAIDPDMMRVYTAGWTGIDWDQRQQLRGKPLALWLHGYYASHAAPVPVKVETLHRLCGSKDKTLYSFRQKLGIALKALEDIDALESWKIDKDTDLVHVSRGHAISNSQRRYLTKQKGRRHRRK